MCLLGDRISLSIGRLTMMKDFVFSTAVVNVMIWTIKLEISLEDFIFLFVAWTTISEPLNDHISELFLAWVSVTKIGESQIFLPIIVLGVIYVISVHITNN